jgi:hypothetical protein
VRLRIYNCKAFKKSPRSQQGKKERPTYTVVIIASKEKDIRSVKERPSRLVMADILCNIKSLYVSATLGSEIQ